MILPLNGLIKKSGKVVGKTFVFKHFDSFQLMDLNGKIEGEAGGIMKEIPILYE